MTSDREVWRPFQQGAALLPTHLRRGALALPEQRQGVAEELRLLLQLLGSDAALQPYGTGVRQSDG